MTPEDFLRDYHKVVVNDPKIGVSAVLNVTNYISGMTSAGRHELGKVAGNIAGAYFGSKNWSMNDLIKQSQPFYIKTSKVIDPTEPFTYGSLQRAFGGRASPEEMSDALRLAVAVKRCKPQNAAAYAQKWFGSDCNAFVGNWLGVSPSTSISGYVNGYGDGTPSGATPDVLVTKNIVKLPPVSDPAKIKQGDLVVTWSVPTTKSPTVWKHIEVVQSIRSAGTGKYYLTVASWGGDGGFETHMKRDQLITLTEERSLEYMASVDKDFDGNKDRDKHGNLVKEKKKITLLEGTKIIAYKKKRGDYDALCFFLDATKLDNFGSRGYDIGGLYGT